MKQNSLYRLTADTKADFEDSPEHEHPSNRTLVRVLVLVEPGADSFWQPPCTVVVLRSTETSSWSNLEPLTQFLRVQRCCRT